MKMVKTPEQIVRTQNNVKAMDWSRVVTRVAAEEKPKAKKFARPITLDALLTSISLIKAA